LDLVAFLVVLWEWQCYFRAGVVPDSSISRQIQ